MARLAASRLLPHSLTTTTSLLLLLCLLESLPVVNANTYTFRKPGHSFLEYHPEWTNGQHVDISFEFRTQKASTFLLHHAPLLVEDGSAKPQLWVGLWNGQLNVTHHYGDYEESLAVGKGLNHDKWHQVTVSLNGGTGALSASVDDRGNQTLGLQAIEDGTAAQAYREGREIAIVSVGGFSPEALQENTHFIGCIRDVQFLDETKGQFTPPVFAQAEVELGCLDQCKESQGEEDAGQGEGGGEGEAEETEVVPQDPCQNGGLCVNHYTKMSCDCFGTGYEGSLCEKQDQTVVTLQGSEWLSFNVYEDEHRTHSPTSRVALEFKTTSAEGILFYGYEHYPQYNHLAVSLHNGTVHVSVAFVDQDSYDELYLAVGANLNDDSWHRVVVEHEGHEVVVTLDGELDKMTTEHDQPHLHMPRTVYYGGMEVQANTLGLKTEESFLGCLRSVYFNRLSVLELLNSTRAAYHGGPTIYGCQRVDNACLQFPRSGSVVQVEHPESETLDVELEFKTLKPDGVLLYTEVREPSMAARGYLQVLLKAGQVEISVAPSVYQQQMKKKSRTFAENVNDNQWHTLSIYYQHGLVHIQFDGSVKVLTTKWLIEMAGSSFLGFGPETHVKDGFIGCLRKIKLQSSRLSPLEVIHSQQGVGVTLGHCDLVDWCQGNQGSQGNDSLCLHGGRCVSEWDQAHCDCHGTQYEGHFCQFSQLRRSCDEYYQIGSTRSGVWQIDPDGPGPLPPTYVLCKMGVELDGRKYGLTHIEHNLQPEDVVRAPELKDLKKIISYRGMTNDMLHSLVQESGQCQQFIQYNCFGAPLWLGRETWLVSASGQQFNSVGGDTDAECGCNQAEECVDLRYTCNCDQRSSRWLSDNGLLRHPDHIPVSEMYFLQRGGSANVTLGPLECAGSSSAVPAAEAMFTSESSYLQLSGWRRGDIKLRFRTTASSALLLYQPSSGSPPGKHPQLLLALQNEKEIVLKMQHPQVEHVWQLPWRMNTGVWFVVSIEMKEGEMRLQVKCHTLLLDLGGDGEAEEGPEERTTHLYVAGTPSSEDSGFEGLTGCIGGLVYNDEVHSLPQYIPDRTTDIVAGCQAGCDASPCQNGASCEEYWTSYTCHCANSLAHFGEHCEHNLNADMIHILEKSSYLQFDQPGSSPDLLNSDILFSFRTTQSDGLLLYLHDQLSNFVQVEIREESVLVFRYNTWDVIHEVNLTVPGLTDGSWQQTSLSLQPDVVILQVNDLSATMPVDREKQTSYEQVPFHFGLKENVIPFRLTTEGLEGFRLFVAGVPESYSRLTGVQGCISGLKVADTQHQLAPLADSRQDLQVGCPSGCIVNPCLNGGLCVEDRLFNGQYTCNCLQTGYSGTLCDKEVGIVMDGSSFLVQQVETLQGHPGGHYEMIHFKFATRSPDNGKNAMVFVRGKTGLSDYLLVYITKKGHIVAEVGIDREVVQLAISRSYDTGDVYRVTLTRDHTDVTLRVDDLEARDSLSSDLSSDPPYLVMVGAVRKENFKFEDVGMYSGELYNVFIESDQLYNPNARPLDTYLGFTDRDSDIRAVGGGIQVKTSSMNTASMASMHTGPQVAAHSDPGGDGDPGDTTLPPWDQGPAQTVNLYDEEGETGESHGAVIHSSVAYIVCIVFLVAFVSIIVIIVIRSRKRGSFSPQGKDQQDEEEGLLFPPPNGEPETTEVERIPTAKLRQGPKSKRTPSGEHFDEENEETPMLQSEVTMATSVPAPENVEMTSFQQAADDLPMMDEDDDLDLTLSPNLRGLRPIRRVPSEGEEETDTEDEDENDTESEDMGNGDTEADQMEWDPQMDGPSPALTPHNENIPLVPMRHPPKDPQDDPLTSDGTPDSQRRAPREVLTESQVLEILDEEDQEPDWDPTADSNFEMYKDEDDKLPDEETDSKDGKDSRPEEAAVPSLPAEDTLSVDTVEEDFFPAEDKIPDVDDTDSAFPLEPTVLVQSPEARPESPSSIGHPQRLSSIFSSIDSFRTAPDHNMLGSQEDHLDDELEFENESPGHEELDDDEDKDKTLKASDKPQVQLSEYAREQEPLASAAGHSSTDHSSSSDSDTEPETVTPVRKASVENQASTFPPGDFNANGPTSEKPDNPNAAVPGAADQAIINSSGPEPPNHFTFDENEEFENNSQDEKPLVPEGTEPLQPPEGKSPGLPLKKGRKLSRERRKS